MKEYIEFIKSKEIRYESCGFEPTRENPKLFQWQNDIVRWALMKGRAAIFADCGLGKTPMQLTVIRRAINLWTNPGDVVLTPFLGIGSEAYVALENGRRAIGIELKPSYFKQAVANCEGVTAVEQTSRW